MGIREITDTEFLKIIDSSATQRIAATRLGVTPASVSMKLKSLRGKQVKIASSIKKADKVVDNQIDSMSQLSKVNDNANEMLDLCMAWMRGDDVALQIMESQVKQVRVGRGEDIEMVKEYKFKDPRDIALKCMGTIKDQLKLQLDIYQTLFDMQAVQTFQESVLEAIGEVSPDVRARIIQKLHRTAALRAVVKPG